MLKNKSHKILIILFSLRLLISPSFSSNLENISNQKYFQTTHQKLQESKKSIIMAMYIIAFNEKRENSINILVNDLVEAHKRGVSVKVVLDQNIAFEKKDDLGVSQPSYKNRAVYDYFKQKGINVYYDDLRSYTHAKCIVIDEVFVIIGSTNWSMQALTGNKEMSVLIKSRKLAKEMIQEINSIKLDVTKINLENYVVLNKDVLINKLSKCIKYRSYTAWNIYFYLLKKNKDKKEVELIYKELYECIYTRNGKGLTGEGSKKFAVRDALKSLDKKNLIKYVNSKMQKQNPIIKLKDSQKFNYVESLKIPKVFFTYEWNKRLSFLAQYCYFINLIEGTENRVSWSLSMRTTLTKKYKISSSALKDGFIELRHWNLLKIQYAKKVNGINSAPNTYRLLPLYKIEDYNRDLEKLKAEYGKQKVEKAINYAKMVYCERDLYEIKIILELFKSYGTEQVDYAFKEMSVYGAGNSKRSMAYIIAILRNNLKKK